MLEEIGYTNINYNNDNRYDIKATNTEGKRVTFEIKEDFSCKKTGNVAVEFGCRGKPSGIETTQANYYVYKLHEPDGNINFYGTIVKELKKAIEEEKYFRTVSGGDKGSNSKNYLFDINDFKKIFVPIMVEN